MTTSTNGKAITGDPRSGWQVIQGQRVTLHLRSGAIAAEDAPNLLNVADQTVTTLVQMLEPGESGGTARIDLYLTDPADAGSDEAVPAPSRDDDQRDLDAPASGSVYATVQVGDPPRSAIGPLVRHLVTRWYGRAAIEAEVMVTGLVGVVAARVLKQPTIEQAHAHVRTLLANDRNVSIFASSDVVGTELIQEEAATSFVAYLIDIFGSGALGQYLAVYNPRRSDAAAVSEYYQPLGTLEEGWLRSIRHETTGGSAFRALFGQLVPLIRPHWIRGVELIVLMVVGVGLTIAAPLTIMHIVDHILPHAHGHYDDLVIFVALLVVVFVLNAACGARRNYVQNWLTEQSMITLHHRLFSHLQRLSHNFYSRTGTSELMTVLTDDLREIRGAIAMVTGNGLYQLLLALCTAITVLILDPLLGLLVLVIVPVFAAGYVALRMRWQREAHGFQRLQGEADHIAHENFSAHREIEAFGLQDHAIENYRERHREMVGRQLRLVNLSSLFESTLHVASGLGYAVVFGFGGYQVISEQGVTIGTLFAFAHLLPLFYEPIERLADLGHTVEGAAGAFEQIDEVLDEPVAITDKPNAIELGPLSEEIRFEHVTFGYEGSHPVLDDFTMTIPAGADVAIVGPSGSGKSTVINLLMRFWDPDQGRVLVDGHDLRDVTVESVRRQMGIVFSETFTFNTSVRENIAVGDPAANDKDIEAAAAAAELGQYVDQLPAGYNTVLGERGVRMSSGQRQRLAIARALLRDPQVLILDEATSALDPQTESEILETLAAVDRNRTTISIKHRLAAVATADIIFVLDQGRLVEQGHHAELVKAGGLYQHLYEEQMLYLHGGGVLRVGIEPERLRRIPLFANLEGEALGAVAEKFMLERYAADELVVRQGDPGDKLYTISRGQLDVLVNGSEGQRRIGVLQRGDYFGEMALLTGASRNATIRTTIPTQLYSLAAADFEALMEQMPEVREAVSETAEWRQAANAEVAGEEMSAPSSATAHHAGSK